MGQNPELDIVRKLLVLMPMARSGGGGKDPIPKAQWDL